MRGSGGNLWFDHFPDPESVHQGHRADARHATCAAVLGYTERVFFAIAGPPDLNLSYETYPPVSEVS
jgi:hypothetical protein